MPAPARPLRPDQREATAAIHAAVQAAEKARAITLLSIKRGGFDMEETARLIGVSKATIYRMCQRYEAQERD